MPIRAAPKIGLDILLNYCLIEGCVELLNSFLPSCSNFITCIRIYNAKKKKS